MKTGGGLSSGHTWTKASFESCRTCITLMRSSPSWAASNGRTVKTFVPTHSIGTVCRSHRLKESPYKILLTTDAIAVSPPSPCDPPPILGKARPRRPCPTKSAAQLGHCVDDLGHLTDHAFVLRALDHPQLGAFLIPAKTTTWPIFQPVCRGTAVPTIAMLYRFALRA